jgi:hypothetical protein
MTKGNRKDLYGFKAAEKYRSLNLTKQVYPQVIHSQRIWTEDFSPCILKQLSLAFKFKKSQQGMNETINFFSFLKKFFNKIFFFLLVYVISSRNLIKINDDYYYVGKLFFEQFSAKYSLHI